MRYITTEQFLGIVLYHLINKNINRLEIDDLKKIEKRANSLLRKNNDAILVITSKDVYFMLEEYDKFLILRDRYIEIYPDSLKELQSKIESCAGIPSDIRKTLEEAIVSVI